MSASLGRNGEAKTLDVRLSQQAPVPLQLSFSVAPGETLAFVGPSGSGKTTTLRIIAGLATPASGRISLGDELWLDTELGVSLRPERRRVGFVFQDYALFPHLTVAGNLELAMQDLAPSDRAELCRELLEKVGLGALAARYPHQISGGERQRVALARALARRPAVLLLDEPFSAVDRPTREMLKGEIRALIAAMSLPVVLVTHDIAEAEALSTKIVVIDKGAVVAAGSTAELFAGPLDPKLARVLGLSPDGIRGAAKQTSVPRAQGGTNRA